MNQVKHNIFLLATCFILIFTACSEDEEPEVVITDNVSMLIDKTINSTVLSQTMKYNIILPNDYYTNTERYYPVLYLFHGMGGNNRDWALQGNARLTLQNAFKNGVTAPMIVVMPDAFNTFYVDGYQNGLKYETYFWEEFLPFIESEYRVTASRDTRFIAGLSMGGFGASYYAFTYPEKFKYCYSMSGAVEGVGAASTPSIADIIRAYDSFSDLPAYTMDCGTADPLVFTSNQSVHAKLLDAGFDHEYIEREGTHDWVFWTKALEMALERIGQYTN
ncbi:alpha/beta hydrolase family protein [Draconibacterium sp. IB214405]|uniref:alpha/beta hydrolase n=1 Tax=Draconibacterium sp. IB214405 TaxID=3097352 RepID=UPI002A0E66F8|nr:alpha/beta hydrolase family protein [Draconibacterium sp. IB214405]MDX8339787.1 alpha/beta hydrolase family protein [Draconibacterium sp. IB214405]